MRVHVLEWDSPFILRALSCGVTDIIPIVIHVLSSSSKGSEKLLVWRIDSLCRQVITLPPYFRAFRTITDGLSHGIGTTQQVDFDSD